MKKNIILSLLAVLLVSSCGDAENKPNEIAAGGLDKAYPMSGSDKRSLDRGKLGGEDGITLLGGNSLNMKGGNSQTVARGVNAYLWQAALDTISFMPIATVDAAGGVIITDWYEDPSNRGEKLKANILINSEELRASGVKVSLFRQVGGKSAETSAESARKLEDKILARAREIKIEEARF